MDPISGLYEVFPLVGINVDGQYNEFSLVDTGGIRRHYVFPSVGIGRICSAV